MKKLLQIILISTINANVYSQTFSLHETLTPGLRDASISWADINNDGNLDFIQTGNDIDANATTRLYLNTGSTIELQNTDLPNIFEGATDWGDYDNDGDVDLLLAGLGSDGLLTRLYDNIDGDLSLNENASLHGIDRGSVEWGDYDNDGDLDILISGQDAESGSVTKIYSNDSGTFTEVETAITGVSFGIASWVDFDGDGDLDVMVSGVTGTAPDTGPKVSELFENTGTTFSLVFDGSFEGVMESSLDFGDYDNDGDIDILLAGLTNSNAAFTAIYQNNESSFDIVFDGSLPDVFEGQVLWGDADNDGDLDVFVSGIIIPGYELIAQLYSNTGSGFELEFTFNEAGRSSASFGDFDSDGDLDIFITSHRNDLSTYSGIYLNENTNETLAANANTKPSTPGGLTSLINDQIELSWDPSSDNNTPIDALTYALYIRSASDTLKISSSLDNGKRKLVKRGNSGSSNAHTLQLLEPGDYFWSVQSIDNTFEGSSFADEGSFHINFPPAITGTSTPLSTPEETSLLIDIQDLVIDDPDNDFPADFTLSVLDGDNYSVNNNTIEPDLNFNGTLSVSVIVNDGIDDSELSSISIDVTPVNDPPIITGSTIVYRTTEAKSITININDLIIEDPDNEFPTEFTLEINEGDNYQVTNNVITPNNGFLGLLTIPITVNDGMVSSEPYDLMVDVILGISDASLSTIFSIFPNPASDFIVIEQNEILDTYQLVMYDLNGSILLTEMIDQNQRKEVDISQLSKGSYVLQISNESNIGTVLIVKE